MSSGRQPVLIPPAGSTRDEIELLMPARTAPIAAARTLLTSLAAHNLLDFEAAAGMRLATGDACAAPAGLAEPGSTPHCRFRSVPGTVQVRPRARSRCLPAGTGNDPGRRRPADRTAAPRVSADPDRTPGEQVITVELSTSSTGGERHR